MDRRCIKVMQMFLRLLGISASFEYHMLRVYGHYTLTLTLFFNSSSVGINFRRHNLTSKDLNLPSSPTTSRELEVDEDINSLLFQRGDRL